MIFLTVGTQFPFDRLVKAVDKAYDEGLVDEEILAQIGKSTYKPHNFKTVPFLDKELFDRHLNQSSSVIGHAGMGIISQALDNNKPLLVMPRLRRYKEVINDHQVDIAMKYEQLGHVLAAYAVDELPEKIQQLSTYTPKKRVNQVQLVARRITEFLNGVSVS